MSQDGLVNSGAENREHGDQNPSLLLQNVDQQLSLQHLLMPSQSIWTNTAAPLQQQQQQLQQQQDNLLLTQHYQPQHDQQYHYHTQAGNSLPDSSNTASQFQSESSITRATGNSGGGIIGNGPDGDVSGSAMSVASSAEEQRLLMIMQQQWAEQRQPQSHDQPLGHGIAEQGLTLSHGSNVLPSQQNHSSFSVGQDLFVEGSSDLYNNSIKPINTGANSFHRSSSDLGTRINSYHMVLGDLTGTAVSNVTEAHTSALYSNKPLGQFSVPHQDKLPEPSSTEGSSLFSFLDNSYQSLLGHVMQKPHSLIDNNPALSVSSYDRAPGTPLSHTPPPKLSDNQDASPSSQPRTVASSVAYEDTNTSSLSNKSKKIKKTTKPVSPKPKVVEVEAAPTVESIPQIETPEFSFYSDQNNLFEKMGNLSNSIVNWMSSDKSSSARKSIVIDSNKQKMEQPKSVLPQRDTLHRKVTVNANSVPSDIIVPIPKHKPKTSLSNKLSYSDVLSNPKILQEKSSNNVAEQFGYSSGSSQSLESSSSASNRSKATFPVDNYSKSSSVVTTSQPYQGYTSSTNSNRTITGHTRPQISPLLSSRKNKTAASASGTFVFGSRVGLDEFNSPTPEELGARTLNNWSNTGDKQQDAAGAATTVAVDSSALTPAINVTLKKSKLFASSSSGLLNNKNKIANQKQILK